MLPSVFTVLSVVSVMSVNFAVLRLCSRKVEVRLKEFSLGNEM